MDDLLDKLTLEDIRGEGRALADVVGIEAFKNLIRYYGGTSKLYVPSMDKVVIPIRDELIRREYNGENIHELVRRWGLTERWIYEIVKDKAKEIKAKPIDGQISLFEETS